MRLSAVAVVLTLLLVTLCRVDACRDDTHDYNVCRRMCAVRSYRQKSKGVCSWDHREGFGITTHDCYVCLTSHSVIL